MLLPLFSLGSLYPPSLTLCVHFRFGTLLVSEKETGFNQPPCKYCQCFHSFLVFFLARSFANFHYVHLCLPVFNEPFYSFNSVGFFAFFYPLHFRHLICKFVNYLYHLTTVVAKSHKSYWFWFCSQNIVSMLHFLCVLYQTSQAIHSAGICEFRRKSAHFFSRLNNWIFPSNNIFDNIIIRIQRFYV